MTEKKPSVLVAIPTNRVKYYALGKLIESLSRLENADEILFVDDTHKGDSSPLGSDDYESYSTAISKYYKVLPVKETTEQPSPPRIRQRLVNARKCLREYFLKSKHTHMLFIDSDVVVPEETITQLLKCKSDIATGMYWQTGTLPGVNGPTESKPYIVAFKYLDDEAYKMKLNEYGYPLTFDDLIPSRVIEGLTAIGFGCCLLSRKLLEDKRWKFRWYDDKPEKKTTEDMVWSLDMIKLGYKIKGHTGVLCKHYPKAWVGPI